MFSSTNPPTGTLRPRYFPVPISDGISQVHPREHTVFPQGSQGDFQVPDSESDQFSIKHSLSKALFDETSSHNDTRARLQATFSTWSRWERNLQLEKNKASGLSEANGFLRFQLDIAHGKIGSLEEKLKVLGETNKRLSAVAKRVESDIAREATPDTLSDYHSDDIQMIEPDATRNHEGRKRRLHTPFPYEDSKRRKDTSLPPTSPLYAGRVSPCTPKAMDSHRMDTTFWDSLKKGSREASTFDGLPR